MNLVKPIYVDSFIHHENLGEEFMPVKYDVKTQDMTYDRMESQIFIDTKEFPLMGDTKEELCFYVPKNMEDGKIESLIYKIFSALSHIHYEGSAEDGKTRVVYMRYIGIGDIENIMKEFRDGKPIARYTWVNLEREIVYRKGYEKIPANAQTREQWGIPEDAFITVKPHVQMREAEVLSEYSFTIEDLLANDWYVVQR